MDDSFELYDLKVTVVGDTDEKIEISMIIKP